MKIPELERPPIDQLYRSMESLISPSYRQLLVLDPQNDCDCSVEIYDTDNMSRVSYIDELGQIKEYNRGGRISLPILPHFHQDMMVELFRVVMRHARDLDSMFYQDLFPRKILANPQYDLNKLRDVFQKTFGRECLSVSQDFIFLDFICPDDFYAVPDPEFLGVFAANLGGMGAFCVANIFKI